MKAEVLSQQICPSSSLPTAVVFLAALPQRSATQHSVDDGILSFCLVVGHTPLSFKAQGTAIRA